MEECEHINIWSWITLPVYFIKRIASPMGIDFSDSEGGELGFWCPKGGRFECLICWDDHHIKKIFEGWQREVVQA